MAFAAMSYLGNVTGNTRNKCSEVLTALQAAQGKTLTHCWGMGGGEHGTGRAIDFMVFSDKAAGDFIANYLWANRSRLGVGWIIWQQKILSVSDGGYGPAGRWNWMEDRGNGTQNHYDHVHVLFFSDSYSAPSGSTPTPSPSTGTPAPGPRWVFPLPDGYYFGQDDGSNYSVSGRYVRSFAGRDASFWIKEFADQLARRGWPVGKGKRYLTEFGNDGAWGSEYDALCLAFQTDQSLGRDKKCGKETWTRAFFGNVT